MSIRNIYLLEERDADLRRVSRSVGSVTGYVRRIANDLRDTLLSRSDGAGLAAPQIGARIRVIAVRLNAREKTRSEPVILINPEIIEQLAPRRDFDACLSVPGWVAQTVRPHYLRVRALNVNGHPFERLFLGFDAVVVHHEIDHLDGILFIDRLDDHSELSEVDVT